MRRVIAALGLELYAVQLALLQLPGGIRTDEAKYLLNIPYPHPPLVRFILSLTSAWPTQEILWRLVFATLVVQAVWLVEDMARALPRDHRYVAMAMWLLSAAVVLQAGSIMMAPLTAVQGLALLAVLHRAWRKKPFSAPWAWFGVALLWTASLLTAFQAVLYLPVVIGAFRRAPLQRWQRVAYVLLPMGLAGLFALANPLLLKSFVLAGGVNAGSTTAQRVVDIFQAWCIAGSVLVSIIGVAGMALKLRVEVVLSLLLVLAFLFVSFRGYYAILLTPLLLAGAIPFLGSAWRKPLPLVAPLALVMALCLLLFPPSLRPSSARAVLRSIADRGRSGPVLIAGDFGHEWEYESPFPVLRYRPQLLRDAQAAVCLASCEAVARRTEWERLPDAAVETWVRK